jgi:transcriptional regulator with XRE-family HTH domain
MSELNAVALIKKARKDKGWTQEKVAAMLNKRFSHYSTRQYQKLEAGEFPVYKEQVITALEEILDIQISELIYGHKVQESDTPYNYTDHPQEISPYRPGEIAYVSVIAQKAYPSRFQDPTFINNLPQVRLPDVTDQGEQYRVFEVKKDSMVRQIVGDFLICNKIELYPPLHIINYGLYTVVHQSKVVMGWLAIKDAGDGLFVLQNLDRRSNKQILLTLEDIKELWLAERIIHIISPVTRSFNIEI